MRIWPPFWFLTGADLCRTSNPITNATSPCIHLGIHSAMLLIPVPRSFLINFQIAEFPRNFRRRFWPKFRQHFLSIFSNFWRKMQVLRPSQPPIPPSQPPIPPKFRQISVKNGNLEKYYLRKLLNIAVKLLSVLWCSSHVFPRAHDAYRTTCATLAILEARA